MRTPPKNISQKDSDYGQRKTGWKIRSGQRRLVSCAWKNFPPGGARRTASMGRWSGTSRTRSFRGQESLIFRPKIYARKKTPPRGEFERGTPVRTHQKIRKKNRALRQ